MRCPSYCLPACLIRVLIQIVSSLRRSPVAATVTLGSAGQETQRTKGYGTCLQSLSVTSVGEIHAVVDRSLKPISLTLVSTTSQSLLHTLYRYGQPFHVILFFLKAKPVWLWVCDCGFTFILMSFSQFLLNFVNEFVIDEVWVCVYTHPLYRFKQWF